jgi:hypothetical protein
MKFRWGLAGILLFGVGALGVLYAQKEFREYPGQTPWPLPPDYRETREWVWARLRYQNNAIFGGFFGGGFGGGRRGGRGSGSWATDYPKGDRYLIQGLRRLTLLDARSVEQTVDLDETDDVYNWPFLYAVEVGRWHLDDEEAAKLRDFIDRGGFFMVDDFHGEEEWAAFMASMERVFPDKDIVDIPDEDPINRTVFDLNPRIQIPGRQFVNSGSTSERYDGAPAHWRGIYDDKNRLIVVIVHNSDLGDAIEWADLPYFPEMFSQAAFRVLSNYVIYDLTH